MTSGLYKIDLFWTYYTHGPVSQDIERNILFIKLTISVYLVTKQIFKNIMNSANYNSVYKKDSVIIKSHML